MDQDLKAYLEDFRKETLERFARSEQQIQEQFGKVDEQFRDLKDDVRRAYVLVEDLRDNVKLVGAEGVASVREQLTERQEEISKKLGEVETFNRDSCKDLRRSYDDLDSRVRRLESSR